MASEVKLDAVELLGATTFAAPLVLHCTNQDALQLPNGIGR